MRGIERQFDVFGGGAGDFAERLAGNRRDVGEVFTLDRWHELAADEIVVALFEWVFYAKFADVCKIHVVL